MNKIQRTDPQIKAQVMEKLREPDSSVTEISKAYGISKATLHKWKQSQRDSLAGGIGHFVELSILGSKKKLKQVSLVFDDVAVSFEGKINSVDLVSIIKILDASC